VVVVGELVDIIRRGLREIVDFEIKRFLEYYDDCEVVDVLHICWHSFDGSYDTIIHGLKCYALVDVMDKNINDVAREIVEKAEVEG